MPLERPTTHHNGSQSHAPSRPVLTADRQAWLARVAALEETLIHVRYHHGGQARVERA